MIDKETLRRYEEYYFANHPKAHKKPIPHPYHESINVWMIMPRPQMNALNQKWKNFIVWLVKDQGYSNLRIEKCELSFDTYYQTGRRHDIDNSTPKFILDGLVEGGMIVDDDIKHIQKLTLSCHVDREHPRTEIRFFLEDTENGT